MTENDNTLEQMRERRSLERISYAEKGKFFRLRNILNFIFIVLAIIGMVLYFTVSETISELLLIICVVIKICECMLRLIH